MNQVTYPSARSAVFANNIVSTSHPLAAQAGLSMLYQGGNAVDAALASAICLTVVEPTGNGLGSDAFAILWDGQKLHGLNASGRSPAAWTPERFAKYDAMPELGWDTVTVPGAVSAWVTLSKEFGKLDFAKLFEPAINYANNGFAVSPIICKQWQSGAERLYDQPGFAQAFMPNGKAPITGEWFINKPLGNSLELIANSQGEAFYRGELAEKMVQFAQQHNAALALDDLAQHQNDWCGTIAQSYGDIELHEIPPNGQGIAALMALGMLQHHDIATHQPDSTLALHLQIEAIKLAFSDLEAYVADPQYMAGVSAQDLLDPTYLAQRAKLIKHDKTQRHSAGAPKHGGTVYSSACDASGMMVSYIQSNYCGFGSGVVVPDTGISLQNRGFGFSLDSNHPNFVGPNKRPFHTIIPGFITTKGQPLMSFGVMGGPMQAQGHLQMLLRTQVYGQNPQQAVDAPRWRFIEGNRLAIEPSLNSASKQGLADLGHDLEMQVSDSDFSFGGAQLIQKLSHGGYMAGSDPRKDGQAVGF